MNYHAEIQLPFALPAPFDVSKQWVKADMVAAVSFDRLDLIRLGKDASGKRRYLTTTIGAELFAQVQILVAKGLSLTL